MFPKETCRGREGIVIEFSGRAKQNSMAKKTSRKIKPCHEKISRQGFFMTHAGMSHKGGERLYFKCFIRWPSFGTP